MKGKLIEKETYLLSFDYSAAKTNVILKLTTEIPMKRFLLPLAIIGFFAFSASAQKFNPAINKDSLLQTIYKKLGTEERIREFKTHYNATDESGKEFLLFMGSMPSSSKKELIANIDSNYARIQNLISSYKKLVPKGFIVSIEYQPANNVISTRESIDMRIQYQNPENFNSLETDQKWDMHYGSAELKRMCGRLNWNEQTLKTIKQLLDQANCISIENDSIPEIGFSRSSMAKYSYLIFERDLDKAQIEKYNNGCTYIYYKKNIVLEFAGGAVGPQCFPEEE